jgi:GTP cyclohydrolase II
MPADANPHNAEYLLTKAERLGHGLLAEAVTAP